MKNQLLTLIKMVSKNLIFGIFIQCVVFTLVVAENGSAQVKSMSETNLNLKNNTWTIGGIIEEIESSTDFRFIYLSNYLENKTRIEIESGELSVLRILEAVSRDTGLKFKQINNSIYIGKKHEKLLNKKELEVSFQTINVTGRVISAEDNSGLPGVNVIVKGTSLGTVTDLNGDYAISVPSEQASLIFSSVGYIMEEVVVGSNTVIDMELFPDIKALEEIVVVGYGTAKKEDLTGAIASANLDETRSFPNTNVVQALQGRVAGVVVTDYGRPGSDATIQIRGQNSISASNDPLIVLDGIIYAGGELADINPGDIESIHILKDASSTAIYGSLAANGVIEVTTKRGKSSKPQFSVNTYYGFSDYAHLPDFLNASEYLEFRKDAEEADGGPIPFSPTEQANIDAGISIEPFEEIRQDAPLFNGELSVSGKTDVISYFVSGSYTDTKSPVAGDKFSRIAGRVNLNLAATKWLNIGLNTGYSLRDDSGIMADLYAVSYLSPWASLYYDDGVPRRQPQDVGLVSNPMYSTLWNERESKTGTLFVNSFAEVTFFDGFSYKLNVGYTQKNNHQFRYNNSYDRDAFYNLGSGSKNYFESQNLTLENILQFSRFIADDHQINATLMYGYYRSKDEKSFLESQNIFNDALGWNALEIGDNFNINTGAGESTQLSAMGRIGYRYKGKYILDMSLRRDGYSAFGEGNKFGLFPSVGVSWNINEESFLADMQNINNLKLRVSWGKNGNRGVDRYSSLSEISSTNYIFGDGSAVGLYPSSFANPNLGWETTTSTNFGIDFGVFNSRLSGSLNYYISNTTDLLLNQKIPNTNGYDSFLRNVGETQNRGFEISLSSVNLNKGSFSWTTDLAFTLNRNEILKLTGNDLDEDGIEDDDIANKWFIGYPLGSNYDYVFDGIYQKGDDLSELPGSKPGDIKFKDVDGDGEITPDDRQVLHSDQPDFILGLTNVFSYKGFSLTAVLNWRQGGYSPNSGINIGRNFYYEANVYNVPYWTPDNPINDWPALNYGNPLAYGFYQNRSYVRLQDVSLGYTFPITILQKTSISNLKVYVSGKNLFTWTDWIGWDPEYSGGGISPGRRDNGRNNAPILRSYTVGLNIQF